MLFAQNLTTKGVLPLRINDVDRIGTNFMR